MARSHESTMCRVILLLSAFWEWKQTKPIVWKEALAWAFMIVASIPPLETLHLHLSSWMSYSVYLLPGSRTKKILNCMKSSTLTDECTVSWAHPDKRIPVKSVEDCGSRVSERGRHGRSVRAVGDMRRSRGGRAGRFHAGTPLGAIYGCLIFAQQNSMALNGQNWGSETSEN